MGRRDANVNSSKAGPSKSHHHPGKIDFLGLGNIFAVVSILLVIGSLALILIKGFNYGIDYAGGTEVQVLFNQKVEIGKVREFMKQMGYGSASVQSFGGTDDRNEYLIRLESVAGKTEKETNDMLQALNSKLTTGLTESFVSEGASIRRVDSVGPQAGSELKRNGLLAGFYSLLAILIYVGLRFDYKFAPGAVFCLFHDAIVVLGVFSLFGREVNLQTMAAVLTVIGYSLNDTIIIFDRIRENEPLFREEKFTWLVNRSVNDTLSRTILTSGATFLSVAALYLFAGGVIRDFAFTMGLGILIGTYSTIYVASPLVILLDNLSRKPSAV
jgi:preprotein translocase subunit SecF